MAIATLELCFRNPAMFERNIKITKGHTCQLMIESTQNLQTVCEVFKKQVRAIRKKNKPKDPNFLKISIACGKIEQFIESIFPSQKPEDAIAKQKQNMTTKELAEKEKKAAETKEASGDVLYLGLAVFGTLFVLTFVMVCGQLLFTILVLIRGYSSDLHGFLAQGSILRSNSSNRAISVHHRLGRSQKKWSRSTTMVSSEAGTQGVTRTKNPVH